MSTEILVATAALIVIVGLAWYLRSRGTVPSEDAEVLRERQQAAAASEAARTEAMVRRVCPHCNAEVEASATTCPTCGYRFP